MFHLFGLTWPIARISVGQEFPLGAMFIQVRPRAGNSTFLTFPFMDSLSFPFLLFASDYMALVFGLPHGKMAE